MIIFGAGIYLYISLYFLPIQLKQILTGKAQEYIGRKITFKEITYTPLKGIVIHEPVIYQRQNPQEPFFKANEISGQVVITAFFKNQQIVIPSINLKQPHVTIMRTGPEAWNFSDLLNKRTDQKQKSPIQVLVGSLKIEKGRLAYENKTGPHSLALTLHDMNLAIKLSPQSGIDFDITTQLQEGRSFDVNSKSSLQAKGRFNPLSKELNTTLSAQNIALHKILPEFLPHLAPSLNECTIHAAQTNLHSKGNDFHLEGKIHGKADATYSNYAYKGTFYFKDLAFKHESPATVKLSGLAEIQESLIRFNQQGSFDGSATVHFHELNVSGQNISGKATATTGPAANIQLNENRTLSGMISLSGLSLKKDENTLNIDSQITINQAQARWDDIIHLKGDLPESSLSVSLKNKVLTLNTSFRINEADIKIQDDKQITGTIIAKDLTLARLEQQMDGTGELSLEKGTLNSNGISYSGSPQLTFEFVSDPRKNQPLTYRGILKTKQGLLENIPRIGWLDNIEGTVNFRTQYFQTDNLHLSFDGIPIQVSGAVTGIEDPQLDIEAQLQNADLAKLYSYLSDEIKKRGIEPTGSADITLAYEGPLKPFDNAGLDVQANVRNGSLRGLKAPANLSGTITDITGIIKFKNNIMYWKNLQGLYANKIYKLNGQMKGLVAPLIETEIVSSDLNLYSRLNLSQDAYDIEDLRGVYKKLSFGCSGRIHKTDPQNLYLDIDGNLAVDAADLIRVLPPKMHHLKSFDPEGTLTLSFSYKGPGTEPHNARLTSDLTCEDLILNGYHFKKVSADLNHDPGQTGALNAYALFYNGDLAFSSLFDLNKKTWPAKFSAQLKNCDLFLLRKDSQLKGQDLAGKLNVQLDGYGSLKDLNTIKGQGQLTITEGHIWKLKLLEGVWKLLFIPEFEGVIFTEAYVPLTIKDRQCITDNLLLKGKTADMTGHGWIDFDKKINITVSPTFRQTEVFRSSSLKKSLSSILADSEGYIEINITGTLDKPRYSLNTLPTKVLKKATDALIEGVGDLLEDLF